MASDNGQLSFSSGIGLKTVVGEFPTSSGDALELSSSGCKVTTSRLGRTVARQGGVRARRRYPFFTGDRLRHVIFILLLRHPSVQEALPPQLTSSSRLAACQCSITAIGFPMISCSRTFLAKVMGTLLAGAAKNASTSPKKAIGQQAGYRMGDNLGRLGRVLLGGWRRAGQHRGENSWKVLLLCP